MNHPVETWELRALIEDLMFKHHYPDSKFLSEDKAFLDDVAVLIHSEVEKVRAEARQAGRYEACTKEGMG